MYELLDEYYQFFPQYVLLRFCLMMLDLLTLWDIFWLHALQFYLYVTGFHVDDSEVTLNVCLGKEFTGGDLFFRGVRCDKHVNGEAHREVCAFFMNTFMIASELHIIMCGMIFYFDM